MHEQIDNIIIYFSMTDSIGHSSLPCAVLEKVNTFEFCIYPRKKVDPMFSCVYISMLLKSYS